MEVKDTILFLPQNNIPENISKDVTYGCIIVYYRPQKDKPYRTRLTGGGNLIKYPGEVSTRTSDLTTTNIYSTV